MLELNDKLWNRTEPTPTLDFRHETTFLFAPSFIPRCQSIASFAYAKLSQFNVSYNHHKPLYYI